MLVARLLVLLSVLLAVSQAQSQAGECGKFRQESCQARGSQVLEVVGGIQSALECQVGCISALQGPLALECSTSRSRLDSSVATRL